MWMAILCLSFFFLEERIFYGFDTTTSVCASQVIMSPVEARTVMFGGRSSYVMNLESIVFI
jgi:hypothetical protein